MSNNVVAVIPARGGSKGIPRKNIKLLNNRPLLSYTAQAALHSKYIKHAILSTDDEEIASIGRKEGLEVLFIRPDYLSKDDTPGLYVIQHAVKELERANYTVDTVVTLQPTSPLRTSKHIDDALDIFFKGKSDSLVSVTEVPHNANPYAVMTLENDGAIQPFLSYDEEKNLRQLKPVYYVRNGAAIYICSRDCLIKKNSLYGDSILPYFMTKEESFDIDDMVDWKIVECLLTS